MERFLTLCLALFAAWSFFSCKPAAEFPPPTPRFIATAIDPSGTTAGKDWPMPDSLFFQHIIDSLMLCGGYLYVYNLGRRVPRPVILHILCKQENTDVWVSDYGEKKQANDSIEQRNGRSVKQFWAVLNAELFQYRPAESDDYTYLLPAIQSLCHSLNSAAFRPFRQYALLYTDFIHHEKDRAPVRLGAAQLEPLTQTPARVFFSTYADTAGYGGLKVEWLGGPEEFLLASLASKEAP